MCVCVCVCMCARVLLHINNMFSRTSSSSSHHLPPYTPLPFSPPSPLPSSPYTASLFSPLHTLTLLSPYTPSPPIPHLEWDLPTEGTTMRDRNVFPVAGWPTVQLHTATAKQQCLNVHLRSRGRLQLVTCRVGRTPPPLSSSPFPTPSSPVLFHPLFPSPSIPHPSSFSTPLYILSSLITLPLLTNSSPPSPLPPLSSLRRSPSFLLPLPSSLPPLSLLSPPSLLSSSRSHLRTSEVGIVRGIDQVVVHWLVHVIVLVQVNNIKNIVLLTHQVLH